MPILLCFGFGYCAQHYLAAHGGRFRKVIGTTRTSENAAQLAHCLLPGRSLEITVFDGKSASDEITSAVDESDALLVSAPPAENHDGVLAVLKENILGAPRLRTIVYLSTVGVYGDHGGGWVDEDTAPQPLDRRGRARLQAEQEWQKLGAARGTPVAVLRLAGIYGPGQNALVNLSDGRAKRIVKPGQVFNRIHVGDIAQAIDAAFASRAAGIFNVADDEPSPPGDPIVFAAGLLGIAPPPEIPFAEAARTMTPLALSFYGESKRVRNGKLKNVLGVKLRYPTYREGLRALHAKGG
jgi:nucleoside-diphosphate-sugar epimerase